ncbi:glycosyltransferase [Proteiniphilum sp.]|uniref:glycosyltransferase n=1 Tax=Proteiniphilum sp. TaxID=1926877 RepID=UPI00332EAFE1
MSKQKMLIFHPVLAPYRIDQFNSLNELYDLEVVFLREQVSNFSYDQENLRKECRFKISYLLNGPQYKERFFRFGMYRKIKQVKPDIILGYEYSFTTQYLILLKSAGLIRQKLGTFIDDNPAICVNVQSKARRIARDSSIRYLNFLVVLSEEVASFYRNTFMLTNSQVIVSPILQLSERLRKNRNKIESLAHVNILTYHLKGKRVVLFVGRFIPEKGLAPFIETIAPVLSNRDDVILILVGEGSEKAKLSTFVSENNLDEKVFFPGKFEADALYAWYASSSGFVLPSLFEPFGAVVNEALIFGLKVLCSQYAGASSLIHPGNGVIVNPSDNIDTEEKFQQFIDELEPVVEDVCLDKRCPLIEDFRSKFIKEWGKLSQD